MGEIETPFEMTVNNKEEEDFLFEHLGSEMYVLEYGSGKSTLAIAKRVKKLVSMEHDKRFYNSTLQLLKENGILNVELIYVAPNNPNFKDDGTKEEFEDYIQEPFGLVTNDHLFDLAFIDGRARVECAKFVHAFVLKKDGLIFIHDYKHPDEQYRRPEYEVVEEFLEMTDKVFTMAKFKSV